MPVPAPLSGEPSTAEFFKNKSRYLEYPVTDAQVTDADFVPFAGELFARMQPFNRYLNRALSGFEMPTR